MELQHTLCREQKLSPIATLHTAENRLSWGVTARLQELPEPPFAPKYSSSDFFKRPSKPSVCILSQSDQFLVPQDFHHC